MTDYIDENGESHGLLPEEQAVFDSGLDLLHDVKRSPLFDRKLGKRVAALEESILVLDEAQFRIMIINHQPEDTPRVRREVGIMAEMHNGIYLNQTKNEAEKILIKRGYLSTLPAIYAFQDLLAEELAHGCGVNKIIGSLDTISPTSFVFKDNETSEELLFEIQNAMRDYNSTATMPTTLKDVYIRATGFSFDFLNQDMIPLITSVPHLKLEEARAMIVQTAFELSHYGKKAGTVNSLSILENGISEIARRSNIADYSAEINAINLLMAHLSNYSKPDIIKACQDLINRLCTMDLDNFFLWAEDKPYISHYMRPLIQSAINYKSGVTRRMKDEL